MKRISALAICLVLVMLCFTGCQEKNEYTPTGEFYIKTSPSLVLSVMAVLQMLSALKLSTRHMKTMVILPFL